MAPVIEVDTAVEITSAGVAVAIVRALPTGLTDEV
jgi:hypothetical protein